MLGWNDFAISTNLIPLRAQFYKYHLKLSATWDQITKLNLAQFFTGVFGVFDGTNMDSAVMIRFIEKKGDQLIFKSGGGITAQSEVNSEYNEMIQKVYVPFVWVNSLPGWSITKSVLSSEKDE